METQLSASGKMPGIRREHCIRLRASYAASALDAPYGQRSQRVYADFSVYAIIHSYYASPFRALHTAACLVNLLSTDSFVAHADTREEARSKLRCELRLSDGCPNCQTVLH